MESVSGGRHAISEQDRQGNEHTFPSNQLDEESNPQKVKSPTKGNTPPAVMSPVVNKHKVSACSDQIPQDTDALRQTTNTTSDKKTEQGVHMGFLQDVPSGHCEPTEDRAAVDDQRDEVPANGDEGGTTWTQPLRKNQGDIPPTA